MSTTTRPEGAILCRVCGLPGGLLALSGPCMACARARAKVATTGRGSCTCPRHLVQPKPMKHLGREWVHCLRCLGTVRQLR